ncbi:hypothetical protein REIS_2091, partial [Rickettsia endosymbiont of Ixodes scapularis]
MSMSCVIPQGIALVIWLGKPVRCHTVAWPRYSRKQLKILILLVFLTGSRDRVA